MKQFNIAFWIQVVLAVSLAFKSEIVDLFTWFILNPIYLMIVLLVLEVFLSVTILIKLRKS